MMYVENSNVVTLRGLKDNITDEFINDATVELTGIFAVAGDVLVLGTAMAMAYVTASSGDYRAILPEEVPLIAGKRYKAVVSADAGTGRVGLWRLLFTAKRRSTS